MILSAILMFFSITLFIILYIEKKRTARILEKLQKIDFKPLEEKMSQYFTEQNKYFARLFDLEMAVENQRKAMLIMNESIDELRSQKTTPILEEYEKNYRDVVRKVLELDNKFTAKFRMLAEAVLKLGKEKK